MFSEYLGDLGGLSINELRQNRKILATGLCRYCTVLVLGYVSPGLCWYWAVSVLDCVSTGLC